MMKHRRLLTLPLLVAAQFLPPLPSVHAADAVQRREWATPVAAAMNLHRVTPMLFRSAQIHKGDVKAIRSLGVRTIVNLRAFHSDQRLPGLAGIRLVRIPMKTWHIEDEDVIAALRAIRAAEALGPVLLHCQHGADRTGVVTAMYRMVFQGWSREQALDELRNGGFGYHTMWRNIPRYLRNVDIAAIKRALG
ncbi:protein-tyrosine-phosphatase [Bosea caraganae]|uniref:Protein-tyrosine-phosphatase n=1 Tax=Bosea caraganae TaxID=2763117 RepID=A0A370L8K8_9HYPH|nr:dual specificity protein phosphatase family protein [Bosea caraganae]RDJ26709.1 protein-tyrosine-phosphatase [Bosea caraganae]RDJ30596.1 protein-tyrosine-phosphatase [Bosea caraganae]